MTFWCLKFSKRKNLNWKKKEQWSLGWMNLYILHFNTCKNRYWVNVKTSGRLFQILWPSHNVLTLWWNVDINSYFILGSRANEAIRRTNSCLSWGVVYAKAQTDGSTSLDCHGNKQYSRLVNQLFVYILNPKNQLFVYI